MSKAGLASHKRLAHKPADEAPVANDVPPEPKKKRQIQGFSQGVRENAAARMVKLARPICPNSATEMTTTPEGRIIPKREQDPNRQNHQLLGHGWWEVCEAEGHNPYFTSRQWYEQVETIQPDGSVIPKTVKHGGSPCPTCGKDHTYLNVAQVAAHVRVNSGRGVQFALERKGFRRLRDMGYEEVCQFRNCQKVAMFKSRVGLYCSQQHAILCGADAQNIMLSQYTGRFEAGSEMEAQQKRQRGLIEASQFIDVQPI